MISNPVLSDIIPLPPLGFSPFLTVDSHTIPDNTSSKGRQEAKIKWLRWIWHSDMDNDPLWLPFHFSSGFTTFLLGGVSSPWEPLTFIQEVVLNRILFRLTSSQTLLGTSYIQIDVLSEQSHLHQHQIRTPSAQSSRTSSRTLSPINNTFLLICLPCSFVHYQPGLKSVACFRLFSLALLSNYLTCKIFASLSLQEKKSSPIVYCNSYNSMNNSCLN